MKRALCMAAVVAMSASLATAANLNLKVQSGGLSAITVAPGVPVDYEILGMLSTNADNEGLALFGLTLSFDGGDLSAADIPAGASSVANPMPVFVRPEGITNPDADCASGACGFGGTIIGGDLVQIGGGQNTILNTVGNAPFPIGNVITGIAHTELVLVTGSLTAPSAVGVYNLVILPDAFANVIKFGETGTPFWATEAAGVGTITNLVITVEAGGDANLASSDPACGVSWPRSANNFAFLTFDADVPAPLAGQVQVRELLAGGAFGPDLSAGFVIAVQNDGAAFPRVLTIRETGTKLADRTWYAVSNNGWAGVAPFEVDIVHLTGDADGNGRVLNADVGSINAVISPLPKVDDRRDIDGSGRVLNADVGIANSKISPLMVPKPTGHLCAP